LEVLGGEVGQEIMLGRRGCRTNKGGGKTAKRCPWIWGSVVVGKSGGEDKGHKSTQREKEATNEEVRKGRSHPPEGGGSGTEGKTF